MGGVSRASIIFLRKWNPFCSSGKESIATMRWPTNVQSDKRDSKDYFMYYKRCERRIRREDECCAKRRDANDKKTSFGIPYPINNPPIRAGMQKKMLQASQWTKNTQKCVSHFFSNVCELQFKYTWVLPEFWGPELLEFFLNFSHCLRFFSIKKHTPDAALQEKNYALYASGRGF